MTVKSVATRDVAAELARPLAPDAVVISFQNGLGNVDLLRAALPGRTVLAGMVPFNVVHRGRRAVPHRHLRRAWACRPIRLSALTGKGSGGPRCRCASIRI
ncbi:2-dehydropantoate 2-reductase N-terminal domain-containing protein [Microlunatus parietis]|uniref:Ketopantoate reductase n=1 Tax=Microlunatus parietis TaxID=682979 RepID=A0A7Y9I7R4_9ACTN|nr:2-dehydropantoate 2-reductase N-terminal domain-containing protein [Microlunatus parietis]NYE71314.1 ketopantoate reductase [Microlunatus parietis]